MALSKAEEKALIELANEEIKEMSCGMFCEGNSQPMKIGSVHIRINSTPNLSEWDLDEEDLKRIEIMEE